MPVLVLAVALLRWDTPRRCVAPAVACAAAGGRRDIGQEGRSVPACSATM